MLTVKEKRRLIQFLNDDAYREDVTSAITQQKEATAVVLANEPCVLAGLDEAAFLFKHLGLEVRKLKKDGQKIKGGAVLQIQGNNRDILRIERTALNVLGRMSGVATLCAKAQANAGKTRVALTRKTIPGFGFFDKKSAGLAGVWSHRLNLAEAVLIKENHLAFFDSITEAVGKAKETGKLVEIEVENLNQAKEAASANPDRIMLDNFAPSEAKKAVKAIRAINRKIKIELSGGINWKNLRQYATLGADFISMGLLTKSAKMIDFSLDVL